MKQNMRNSENSSGRFVGRLATEKKKTVLAVCLIGLMAFMWIKVLTKKEPKTANAALKSNQTGAGIQLDTELNISYIKLPEIEGRNDSIKKDMFVSNGWKDFVNKDNSVVLTKEVNVVPGDVTESEMRRIADNLKLEAFVMGESPRAYINDRVVSVGDKLSVSDGAKKYECEVLLIKDNSVVMRCGKAEVILKLKQVIEND